MTEQKKALVNFASNISGAWFTGGVVAALFSTIPMEIKVLYTFRNILYIVSPTNVTINCKKQIAWIQ